ncbi:MAG: hypothetical protein J7518_06045 [Nocardioidaceae bacterium]|nr:hypothetical protein [Nocardioidaceae bacterium]
MSGLDRWWLWRTQSTVVLSPVLVVLGCLVSLSNADYADPYWLDLSSKSTVSVLFLAPGFAALAAWDGARWRRLAPAAVRSWIALLALCLSAVALATLLTFAITLLVLDVQVRPAGGAPRLDVLALGVLVVSAYAAVGFVLGRYLPRLIAAPLAFGLVWGWVAFTPAVQPFWMRNVTGNLGTSCCALDVELVPLALVAPGLLAVALLASAAVVLAWSWRRAAWVVAALLVAGSLAAAASMMRPVGADPVQRRTGSQVCVTAGSRSFCAWPEHDGRLRRAAPSLGRTAQRLAATGLDVPPRLRESTRAPGGWSFSLGGGNPDQWGKTLAVSPLDELPPPCTDRTGGVWPAGENLELAGAWLLTAGGADEAFAAEAQGASLRRLRELRALPVGDQVHWYARAYAAMQTCEPVS